MAITQLNDQGIGTTDFTKLVNATDKNAKGLNRISISEYNTNSAPVVKVGSVFENNGATFIVESSDVTPTGYSAIAVSTTFYLYYDDSGTTFIFSSTAPTWSDALQGYYNGNDRAFFSIYKDSGGTLYQNKNLLMAQNNYGFPSKICVDEIKELTPTNGIDIEGVHLEDGVVTATTVGADIINGGGATGIDVQSELLPVSSPTEGTKVITTSNWSLPRGWYNIAIAPLIIVEINVSGAWYPMTTSGGTYASGCFLASSGTNVRMRTGSGTASIYYQKY